MSQAGFLVLMFILGAGMGSFLGCQAWRFHERGKKLRKLGKWSICLSCGHRLSWSENIPIISWLALKGRCKKCHAKIGYMEFLAEVLMAVAFVLIGTTIDVQTAGLVEWEMLGLKILLTLCLGFLAIYDGKWGELPVFMFFPAAGFAIALMILRGSLVSFSSEFWLNLIGAVAILGGLYLMLYLISRGKWVGDGDYILGAIIGVALANAWLAVVTLFVANLLGTIVTLVVTRGKAGKGTVVHFGPFLVAAFVMILAGEEYLLMLLA